MNLHKEYNMQDVFTENFRLQHNSKADFDSMMLYRHMIIRPVHFKVKWEQSLKY